VQDAVAFAGQCLLVTTPEPTALVDLYAVIKVLRTNNWTGLTNILVNRVEDEQAARGPFETLSASCRHFLMIEPHFAGFVLEDPAVPQSVAAQVPLVVQAPTSKAARNLERLAEQLLVELMVPAEIARN
jgi:flagellar biosynthesis protein FlhG